MGDKTGIEWTDSTWSPLKVRVREDAAQIASDKGYTSLVKIGEKMAGRVGQHCEHVSAECLNCYSGTWQGRGLPTGGTGLAFDRRSRDLIEPFVDGKELLKPLHWRNIRVHEDRCGKTVLGPQTACTCVDKYRFRERMIFVENQSDIFGEWYMDEMLDQVFGVMLATLILDNRPDHLYQVLTKRHIRMYHYFADRTPAELLQAWAKAADGFVTMENEDTLFSEMVASATCHDWDSEGANSSGSEYRPWGYTKKLFPLPNMILMVSAGDQPAADERIPALLATPAAKRGVSYEPALGPVDFTRMPHKHPLQIPTNLDTRNCLSGDVFTSDGRRIGFGGPTIDLVIWGGESGPGARPSDIQNGRSTIKACHDAGKAAFMKQVGAVPMLPLTDPPLTPQSVGSDWPEGTLFGNRTGDPRFNGRQIFLKLEDGKPDRKGGNMAAWAEDLRVRELPR